MLGIGAKRSSEDEFGAAYQTSFGSIVHRKAFWGRPGEDAASFGQWTAFDENPDVILFEAGDDLDRLAIG